MNCRWNGTQSPRMLRSHLEDCDDHETCPGCQPCGQPHCRVCAKEHVDRHETACPECVGSAREDLAEIARMCRSLPTEVKHKGVDSEAMALLAPAADPEAWGHITTSLNAGRLPADYLQCDRCDGAWPCSNPNHADSELHPLFVLGTWEQVWRDALDHETDARITIAAAVRYLAQQMTYMAAFEHAPFEDFARDLRRCRAHIESVLHDGEQVDRGAACRKCDVPQVKCYRGRELPWSTKDHPALAHEDGWACPRCKRWSSQNQYYAEVKADGVMRAEWLTDADMESRTGIKANTVRSWARDPQDGTRPLVRKMLHSERTVYRVEDVYAAATEKGFDTRNAPDRRVVA